ncbi:MAG: cytochrome c biogenesis protein CcsA [Crocinitomicaceae bacterium]|nr:cytochrome c biogenesis protein CcsA [Crocinitomicaceae bacterium]
MLERLFKNFFAMRYISMALLLFLLAIGSATFLESIYGIQTAKIVVYNSTWFTLLLIYLSFGLISNIFTYQMWQAKKIALFSFHIAFLIIMIGAALTRYIGFEGLMVIREGSSSNFIYSADPKLLVFADDGQQTQMEAYPTFLSPVDIPLFNNHFSHSLEIGKKSIEVEYLNFQSKMIDSLEIKAAYQETVIDIITNGMQSNYLEKNEVFMVGNIPVSFGKALNMPGIEIKATGKGYLMRASLPIRYLPMSQMQKARQTGAEIPDSAYHELILNEWDTMRTTTLYQAGSEQFVIKQIIKHARKKLFPSGKKNVGADYLTLKVSSGKDSKVIRLMGGMGALPTPDYFLLDGIKLQLEYGSIRMPLPFSMNCNQFTLTKYPGSESPSSFESELTIIDPKNNYESKRKVFMNNVTDYKGYRFFQSSYDLDDPKTPENEEGTRLSVNYDELGTTVTYIGYLLMAIGMILSVFSPNGRFRDLNTKLEKLKQQKNSLLVLLMLISTSLSSNLFGQHDHSKTPAPIHRVIGSDHSQELASLLVQNYEGRIVPFHSLSDQLSRKIHGKNHYKDLNCVQFIMSMHMYPEFWAHEPIIAVPAVLQERLKLKKFVPVIEISAKSGNFKWQDLYQKAFQKSESKRDEFEKKLIKLNEKFEVVNSILGWQYMRIIPKKKDANNTWYIPMDRSLMQVDSITSYETLKYFSFIDKAAQSGNYSEASQQLLVIKKFQRTIAANVVPSENKVNIEISYNKMQLFANTWKIYLLVGFLMLILFYISVFTKLKSRITKVLSIVRKVFVFILIVFFIYHGIGLGFRWYISGHAPWSNGYEAVIFIAWITMIAGFLFSRKNAVVLPGTVILAALMIFVTEMNLLDPEITPLVPVLKSYWLMIHVAIITGSYGFLGLACVLGLLNIILYIFRRKSNGEIVTRNITELTYISEMTMTIGVFMLTIGTFLGGIWANESWGRYWGWDPKETWALVSVLVYAVILHFRYIPAMKSKFVFNIASFWGYSAILFTFFGVNFMLVGLHSYAQGDGLGKVPNWVIVTIIVFALLSITAGIRNKSYNKLNSK